MWRYYITGLSFFSSLKIMHSQKKVFMPEHKISMNFLELWVIPFPILPWSYIFKGTMSPSTARLSNRCIEIAVWRAEEVRNTSREKITKPTNCILWSFADCQNQKSCSILMAILFKNFNFLQCKMICLLVFHFFWATNIISLLLASGHFVSLVNVYFHSSFVFEIIFPKQTENKSSLLHLSSVQQSFFSD